VFDANARKHDGPITLFALPNDLGHPRLGLSISKRRLGSAVARNAMKRRIREAFRVIPKDELGSFDYLITIKPHTPLSIDTYERSLRRLSSKLRRTWEKRKNDSVADS
jgi:ribonuclease P protein component